jgi:hypothetical protein
MAKFIENFCALGAFCRADAFPEFLLLGFILFVVFCAHRFLLFWGYRYLRIESYLGSLTRGAKHRLAGPKG